MGRQIFFGVDNGTGLPAEVIGVVGDVRSRQLAKPNDVEFYRPWPQRSFSFFNVLVRTSMKPDAAQAIVRGAPRTRSIRKCQFCNQTRSMQSLGSRSANNG